MVVDSAVTVVGVTNVDGVVDDDEAMVTDPVEEQPAAMTAIKNTVRSNSQFTTRGYVSAEAQMGQQPGRLRRDRSPPRYQQAVPARPNGNNKRLPRCLLLELASPGPARAKPAFDIQKAGHG